MPGLPAPGAGSFRLRPFGSSLPRSRSPGLPTQSRPGPALRPADPSPGRRVRLDLDGRRELRRRTSLASPRRPETLGARGGHQTRFQAKECNGMARETEVEAVSQDNRSEDSTAGL